MNDLYTEILNFNKMNFDRDQLIEDYASNIVDGMDLDTLVQFAYDTIVDNMESCSDNEVLEQIEEFCPELLEEIDVTVPPVDVAQ
jgi:hypothetical protein